MKKILFTVLLVIFVLSLNSVAFAQRPIKIVVGGEPLVTDVAPMVVDGRTLLPVRAVFESIGASVEYIADEAKVVAVKGDREVSFVIGSKSMTINGEEKEIDVASTVVNNRTLVPLRACAEAFDLEVVWDNDTKTAKVKTEVAVISKYIDPISKEETTFTYDENGNVTYIDGDCAYFGKISFGNVDKYYEKYEYDAKGNLIYFEDANGVKETNTYNEYGEIIRMENQDGIVVNYIYDDNGNLTDEKNSDNTWIKYTYDASNKLIKEEDSEGMVATYTYNEKGLLTAEEILYHGMEEAARTTYEYDANGNMTLEYSHADDWNFTYEYDDNGNLLRNINAYGDTVMSSYVYTYDENGMLIREEPEGLDEEYTEYTEYAYDEDGFLTTITETNGRKIEYIRVVR